MSEAPKPKRARGKAPANAASGLVIDSHSATRADTQATGDAGTASQAASRPASEATPETDSSHNQTSQTTRSTNNADSHVPPMADTATQPTKTDKPAGQQDTGNAASKAPIEASNQHENAATAGKIDMGNVPNPSVGGDTASSPSRARRWPEIRERLMKHAEWGQVIGTVKEMRLDPKLAKLSAEARERFIWGEMDRLYPPQVRTFAPETSKTVEIPASPQVADRATVRGLGDIPAGWPVLPANAALAIELGWVQANRLYVVEELASGGTRVHLDRAHEPAPSRAAIGWLETSIRSYAKYVEVAAKVTGSGDEDGDQVKRERMAIEEIRELLREMAGNPTGPGR